MGGGKDEEKLLSPMFPRLHVNDTEKGGPRAPPRNKMALYEQLTIPTQRFSSGSASATPLPSSTPAQSTSSGYIAGQKRGRVSSPSKCSEEPHHAKKLHSYASKGVVRSNESKLLKASLVETGPLSSHSLANSVATTKISISKNFSLNDAREKDDDFCIPASVQPKTGVYDREMMSSKRMSSSAQLGVARDPRPNIALADPNMIEATQDPVERPAFIHSTKYNDPVESKRTHPSLAKENSTSASNSSRLFITNVRTHAEGLAKQNLESHQDKMGGVRVPGLENSSVMIRESCSVLSPRDGDSNVDYRSRRSEFPKCSTVHLREVEPKDNVSEASFVDSTTAPNISPDTVLELIGEKHFWKARKAIAHQQRIFAVQVFELHRLIEVQKLIAGSPLVLFDDYLDKPHSALSVVKNKPTECAKQLVPSASKKDYLRQSDLVINSRCADKNPLAKLPLHSFEEDSSKLALTQQPSYELRVKDTPQTLTTAAPRSDPWSMNQHPTPGNQWLVPVMSPSEGLIYKPYAGSCPPSAGFMTPMYGNYGSISLNAGSGAKDFYTPAYVVPASHHQGFGYFPGTIPLNQTYFPPYGVPPVTNQSMSGSAPDQMSLFAKVKSKEQENQISTGATHQANSCEMPSQTSHSMPFRVRKVRESKGSELVGSTASSNSERGNEDVLPLFPTEPSAVEESSPAAETSEQNKSRAIKVVPHNRKSATESAARIFQLIQEERKQL